MYDEDDFKLNIEKLPDILNVGYPHFYFLLIFLINSIAFLYDIRTYRLAENIWSIQARKTYLIQVLFWAAPFIFTNSVALYFISKIRRETIQTLNTLDRYLQNDEDVIKVVNRGYKSKIHFTIILIALFLFFFQLYSLRSSSTQGETWMMKYELSKSLTDQHAVIVSINVMINYFYILTFLYTCIASSFILSKIGKKLRKIEISEIELIDWKSIGNNTFLISISWVFTISPLSLVFVVAPVAWWSIIEVLVFVISSLFFFTYPMYSTYSSLNYLKTKASIEIKQKIWQHYKEFSSNGLTEKDISKKDRELTHFELYEKRILNISSWPIDLSQIMQFFGAMIGPLIPIIIGYFFS